MGTFSCWKRSPGWKNTIWSPHIWHSVHCESLRQGFRAAWENADVRQSLHSGCDSLPELTSSFLFVLIACAPSPEVKVTEFPFRELETKHTNPSINYTMPVFFWMSSVLFNALFLYITCQIWAILLLFFFIHRIECLAEKIKLHPLLFCKTLLHFLCSRIILSTRMRKLVLQRQLFSRLALVFISVEPVHSSSFSHIVPFG